MAEQKRGHIINISSIGVLTNAPRFSAYVASKSALDAWTRCAASEFADRGINFTTINMPLVKTPMIAPTKLYDQVPTLTPEEAAELICDAIVHKPVRVATRLGITGQVLHALVPRAAQIIMNTTFRMFPDSSAAQHKEPERAAVDALGRSGRLPAVHARHLLLMATHLKPGDPAPDFAAPVVPTAGTVRLADFRGQQAGAVFLPDGRHAGLHQAGLQPARCQCGRLLARGAAILGVSAQGAGIPPALQRQVRPQFPLARRYRPGDVPRPTGWLVPDLGGLLRSVVGVSERVTFIIDETGHDRSRHRAIRLRRSWRRGAG